MPEPLDPDPETATLARVNAARSARLVSDRLEARMTQLRPSSADDRPARDDAPSPIGVSRSLLARPRLAAEEPESMFEEGDGLSGAGLPQPDRIVGLRSPGPPPEVAPGSPPAEFRPARMGDSPVGSTVRREGSTSIPSDPIPEVPFTPAVPGGSPADSLELAEGDDFVPTGRDDRASTPGMPGVRGRLPVAAAALSSAPAVVPDADPTMMSRGAPLGANGGAGFDTTGASARDAAGGTSPELTQINDLLQQILALVQKQGFADLRALPAGGPTAYAYRG